MSPSPTSFVDVLKAVPALVSTCCVEYEYDLGVVGLEESCIKNLRLVCSELGRFMLSHIHHYLLCIGGSDEPCVLSVSRLLKHTRLSWLSVYIRVGYGDVPLKPSLSLEHSSVNDSLRSQLAAEIRMAAFLKNMGSSLSSVNRLWINVHVDGMIGKDDKWMSAAFRTSGDMLEMLSAHGFPDLDSLRLGGPVNAHSLPALGFSCPRLRHLELDGTPHCTQLLSQAARVLPALNKLAFYQHMLSDECSTVCNALSDCSTVTELNLGPTRSIDRHIWTCLPHGLSSLMFNNAFVSFRPFPKILCGPPPCVRLALLKEVGWRNINLEDLGMLLLAAPGLMRFRGRVHVLCSLTRSMPSWELLASRAGTVIGLDEMILHDDGENHVSPFLNRALPQPCVTSLYVDSHTAVVTDSCIPHITSVFSNLVNLHLSLTVITDRSLLSLLRLKKLEHLTFSECSNISELGIMVMAPLVASLRSIRFNRCNLVCRVIQMENLLRMFGLDVSVAEGTY